VALSVPYLSFVLKECTGLLASLCWLLQVFHAISEGCFRTYTTVPKLRFCDRAPRLRPVKLRANFDGSARRVGLVGQSRHEPRYLAFCSRIPATRVAVLRVFCVLRLLASVSVLYNSCCRQLQKQVTCRSPSNSPQTCQCSVHRENTPLTLLCPVLRELLYPLRCWDGL